MTAAGDRTDGQRTGRRAGRPRPPGRRPGPTATRDAILAAARELFGEKGYDGASLRAIARRADVDPALIGHFFGGKQGVFLAATEFPVAPDDVLGRVADVPRDELGAAMVGVFLSIWEDPERRAPLLAMLRSAMTNEQAATMMREFLSSELLRQVAERHDIPLLRMEAAVGQLVGVMILRHVIRMEPIASASQAELVDLLEPVLRRYLAAG